uniref:Uncharacterized protein n=1 Tax=Oryza brachyantha TaxID=4533 RepID=J3LI04_ORYBR
GRGGAQKRRARRKQRRRTLSAPKKTIFLRNRKGRDTTDCSRWPSKQATRLAKTQSTSHSLTLISAATTSTQQQRLQLCKNTKRGDCSCFRGGART